MLLKEWTATPVPHNHGDLFEAIVTENDGRKLIAQCTSLEIANHIIGLHNATQQSSLPEGEYKVERVDADTVRLTRVSREAER